MRYFGSPVLDFLNVRYLVSERQDEELPEKWQRVYVGVDGAVFENRDVLPRIFAPARLQIVVRDSHQGSRVVNALREFGQPLRDFLRKGDFANEAVVLSTHDAFPKLSQSYLNGRLTTTGLAESSNSVSFRAHVSDRPVIAVTSYVQDAGWSARAGARELPTGLANGPFLTLLLPTGEYDVLLRYSAPGFTAGVAVSIATLVSCIAILAIQRARKQRVKALRRTGFG